jgi:hypothetical protein
MTLPSSGVASSDLSSEAASIAGVLPRASMAADSPLATSSSAPRAMLRVPSERISTMKRATTGGS